MSELRPELLETHEFVGGDVEAWKCTCCGKPRAVHARDGFIAYQDQPIDPRTVRIRCAWNPAIMVRGKALTDKQIKAYEKRGWYAEDFKEARRKLWEKKAKRQGNFVEMDGRMVYSPL